MEEESTNTLQVVRPRVQSNLSDRVLIKSEVPMRRAKTTVDPKEKNGAEGGSIAESEEANEWFYEENARYFMGYFWWQYKKRQEPVWCTWFTFAMP